MFQTASRLSGGNEFISNFGAGYGQYQEKVLFKEQSTQAEKKKKKNSQRVDIKLFCKLWRYAKYELKLYIFCFLLLLAQTVCELQIPALTGQLVDSLGSEKLRNTAFRFIALTVVLTIVTFLHSFLSQSIADRIFHRLKDDAFRQFIKNDIQFFESHKTGDLLSRLGSDINNMKGAISNDFSQFMTAAVMSIGSLCHLFLISWQLSLLTVTVVPLFVLASMIISRITKSIARKQHAHLAQNSIIAEEAFSNIRTIKSFSSEDYESYQYLQKLKKVYTISAMKHFWQAIYMALVSFISFGTMLGVLWLGGYLMSNQRGHLTSGKISQFLITTVYLAKSVSSTSKMYSVLAYAIGVSEKVFEYMDSVPLVTQLPDGGIKQHQINGQIVFRNVDFAYPSKKNVKVLDQFNMVINPGEVIAIVGTSGGGKSTIINLIERFYDPDEGQIQLDGIDLHKYNLKFLHDQIGYVQQEPILFSGTIEQNMTYGVQNYSHQSLEEVAKLSAAYDFITDSVRFPLGFQTLVGERGAKVSAGQKQRIAIARALLKAPKILIFDEATSALDAESESQVQESINNLINKGNMTVIIVAHRLSTVMSCKRILVIANGKIKEEGNHQQLMAIGGLYYQLVQKQTNTNDQLNGNSP